MASFSVTSKNTEHAGARIQEAGQWGRKSQISIHSVNLWDCYTILHKLPYRKQTTSEPAFMRVSYFGTPVSGNNKNASASVVLGVTWPASAAEGVELAPLHGAVRVPKRGRRGGLEPGAKQEWSTL